jgi:hypothetical protein
MRIITACAANKISYTQTAPVFRKKRSVDTLNLVNKLETLSRSKRQATRSEFIEKTLIYFRVIEISKMWILEC